MAVHDYTSAQNQIHAQNGTPETEEVTVVMVPLPAQGHLNQLLHLSRLISSYNIPVHYVCTPAHTRQAKARIQGWDPLSISNLHFHEIPIPPYQTPPPNPNDPLKYPTQLVPAFYASLHLREPLFSLMQTLSTTTKRLVVIHDSFMTYVIQDTSSIPDAESYNFQSISAFSVLPHFWELQGKPEVPESQLLQNLPPLTFPQEVAEYLRLQLEAQTVNSGNLFNSCRAIEGRYLDLYAKYKMSNTDQNWAVGPFHPLVINEKENSKMRHYCLDWLDKQAPNSVIFVSFGSTTSLTDEQIREISIGLEKSEQKFIWVVRDADRADVFEGGEVRKVPLAEEFESRIEGRGIIVRDWAPQLEILAHSSTGGFMSHCGWNSCMESISHGVPIAAWPMHSDQPRNSVQLKEVLKIGLLVRDWSLQDELVTSKSVEKAVRILMDSAEGDELRQRAQELSKAVKTSIMEGASRLEMDSFIAHIRR